jgi:glycosyltransferase involved in cell wall biosynthesis
MVGRAAVSVIIPAFNHGNVIGEAIESVRAQTVAAHQTIVINDGSTDDTPEVVGAFSDVRQVVQKNAGVAAARNRGFDLATGTHVLFLDADDVLHERFIEECLSVLHPSDAGYAYPTAQRFGASDQTWEAGSFSVKALRRQNFVTVTSLMEIAKLNGARFDTSRKLGAWEDWDFFLRLAARRVYGVPAPGAIFFYRKHADGSSRLDTHTRNQLAERKALRYMQLRHPLFFTPRERLSNEIEIINQRSPRWGARIRRLTRRP